MLYIPKLIDLIDSSYIYYGTITLAYVSYYIDVTGKLDILCRIKETEYDQDISLILNRIRSTTKIEKVDTDYFQKYDIYDIYHKVQDGYLEECWILKDRRNNPLEQAVSTSYNLKYCPVCNSPLVYEEQGIYCFNLECASKQQLTISRFFTQLYPGVFTQKEFSLISYLIVNNVVNNVGDFFVDNFEQKIQNHFTALEKIDSIIIEFCNKIKMIKSKKLTLGKYLTTLNLNILNYNVPRVFIDVALLDNHFTTVDAFLEWWEFHYTTPGQSPMPYMSEETYMALCGYLLYEQNVKLLYTLESVLFVP